MGGSSYKGKKAKSHIEERKNQRKKQETEGEEIERRGGGRKGHSSTGARIITLVFVFVFAQVSFLLPTRLIHF
jgi:hypothetical protein